MKRIKNVAGRQKSGNIKYIPVADLNFDYPVFCFRHLHRDFHLDNCNAQEKKSLIEQLVRLSKHSWTELQLSSRHGIGSEKIPLSAIKASIPHGLTITEDVQTLLAFRFEGYKSFIGLRNKFIFHIIYIDNKFCLYSH